MEAFVEGFCPLSLYTLLLAGYRRKHPMLVLKGTYLLTFITTWSVTWGSGKQA